MRTIIEKWKQQEQYPFITAALRQGRNTLCTGLPVLAAAGLTAALTEDLAYPILILTDTEEEAVLMSDNLRPFLGDRVRHFPVQELLPFEVYAHNIELSAARIDILSRLSRGENLLVVTCVQAVSRRLAPPWLFADSHLQLKAGMVFPPDELSSVLVDLGYESVPLTEIPGTFSARGSIVDVFPMNSECPYRVEFFDDEIDSIRCFDAASQRSQEAVVQLLLPPARELPLRDDIRQRAASLLQEEYERTYATLHGPAKKELEKRYAGILEYLQQGIWDSAMEALTCYFYEESCCIIDYVEDGIVVLDEPEQIRDMSRILSEERESRYFDLLGNGRLLPSFYANFLTFEQLRAVFSPRRLLMFCRLSPMTADLPVHWQHQFVARDLPLYAHDPTAFIQDVRSFISHGQAVLMSASSQVRLQRMEEILRDNDYPPVHLLLAGFTRGFESPELGLAVITENELFSRQTKKRQRRIHQGGEKIANFLDLRDGDFVVHTTHGIGQYMGVQRLSIGDIERDYLLIRYAGEDKLYLPVDQLDMIQKYVGNEGAAPKLNKMGGSEWNRAKAKARAAVQDMTEELLRLYAQREQTKGFAYSADTPWQQEFEDAFPYAETPDQLTAVEEIKADMESSHIMDRLLCGDVGYGKTEVALRAVFKAVMDNKQVAILVPTTVLAQQHYRTIEQRMSSFPIRYACLSRFTPPKEQKTVLAKLQSGEIDVVVGTHRLLSADVKFHDLGLLIVDEEQRFGVSHKEKIKELKAMVDVLTLSATPIPRTLHMSLVGMRDMSVINTPPEARFPVQTYVVEQHDRLIRDAIARELARGGQVYFVHNRVFDIGEAAAHLQELLPKARILIGHGQMRERELEQVMLDFVAGDADILVCTTIIESGLDVPNVNTLIVTDADMFGLAQLYQLRGRVGRSDRQAFAYFTYRRDHMMNDMAKKRLVAIRDFTELGSGFKIAMRDLELRGAGNILGPEQHGHIAAVGFDLYCKLLAEEMDKARGKEVAAPLPPTQIDLTINAFIPDSFVQDSVLKVEIYKRFAACTSFEEIDDIASELVDRYGQLPEAVENLLTVSRIKTLARRLHIIGISQKNTLFELKFADSHPILGDHLVALLDKWGTRLVFSDKNGFTIRISTGDIKIDTVKIAVLQQILTQLDEIVRA